MTVLPNTSFAYRLFAQLWAVVEEELRRHSMDIKPNCAGLLQDHIADAVTQLLINDPNPDPVTKDLEEDIDRAELNLRIFILKMIRSAQNDGEPKTRENDFIKVQGEEGTIFTGKKIVGP